MIEISHGKSHFKILLRRMRQVIQKYYDNKNSAKRLLKWTGIAVGIGILFVFMLPIILFLAVIIGILILVSFLYTRRNRKNSNNFGIFDLISSIISYPLGFGRIIIILSAKIIIIITIALVAEQSTKKSYVL